MLETIIIGVDCATSPAKTGLALAHAKGDRCVLSTAHICQNGLTVAQQVSQWLKATPRAILALDAPLGWPVPMAEALGHHVAGDYIPGTANVLFRRATDRFVKAHLGKQSLDVGADRIARTAHSALALLHEIRHLTGLPIPLGWRCDFSDPVVAIEVYPAASLIAHGIRTEGYKKSDHLGHDARQAIVKQLGCLIDLPRETDSMENNADVLDAAVCTLAGFDFLRGVTYMPEEHDLVTREGWIWVRQKHIAEPTSKRPNQ